ncbi:MAG: ABC transporter ATP-binding protein [Betaproteobacteria bacterium]|nr:ABC transporter ATP-binding protein [Betaproteobacteria bacterium]MBT6183458.1 ABC transporter ATP-binding protein [Betaproteobacteria bacterium]MBT6529817.1 ABC transporter ATP-binding protein [Betaproteobacteria bacterium]MBT7998789.1 ABC transporter ATP-binding protein [Betaproteobacteria bacterium]MDC3408470.1 ABC transporter ATP-binding protein [Burkholderiales bacterium]
MSNHPTVISLESVTKRYGSKEIIHGISFEVKKGEIVGFLGPNGAGKTTTMRMISGFTAPTTGKVVVAGHDMSHDNFDGAKKIGYLPEQPPLYDVLKVKRYLQFVSKVKGIHRSRVNSELDRVMNACRLETVTDKEIYKLSKGYRQRVGLAQALLGDPEVLLLDEPTAGLDPGQIQETREVIRSFGENHAVLLSTHILPEVTLICQRIAIINDGHVLAVDSPEALQTASDQTNNVAIEFSGDTQIVGAALREVPGVKDLKFSSPTGKDNYFEVNCHVEALEGIEAKLAKIVTEHAALYSLSRQKPTLENVFLKYVSDGSKQKDTES